MDSRVLASLGRRANVRDTIVLCPLTNGWSSFFDHSWRMVARQLALIRLVSFGNLAHEMEAYLDFYNSPTTWKFYLEPRFWSHRRRV